MIPDNITTLPQKVENKFKDKILKIDEKTKRIQIFSKLNKGNKLDPVTKLGQYNENLSLDDIIKLQHNKQFTKELEIIFQQPKNQNIKRIVSYGEQKGFIKRVSSQEYKNFLFNIWKEDKINKFQQLIWWKQRLMPLSFLQRIFEQQQKSSEFINYIAQVDEFESQFFEKLQQTKNSNILKAKIKSKIDELNHMLPTLSKIQEADCTILEQDSENSMIDNQNNNQNIIKEADLSFNMEDWEGPEQEEEKSIHIPSSFPCKFRSNNSLASCESLD